jgi:hypothetical protein
MIAGREALLLLAAVLLPVLPGPAEAGHDDILALSGLRHGKVPVDRLDLDFRAKR